MSEWLRLLNELKRRPVEAYLTPTQRAARDQVCELLRFPNHINLHGPCGSGKTYVAWGVAEVTGATHVTLPHKLDTLQPPQPILIVDNAPYQETEVRRLMATANMLQASSVVFVTHEAVAMPIQRVYLPLPNREEVAFILQTYERLGFYQRHGLPAVPTLWNLMQACV